MGKESLGIISCEGCDGNAHVKRRSNGKRLLYLHCKSCGLDQRSGTRLQQKWEAAFGAVAKTLPEIEQKTLNNNEWQPAKEDNHETETNEINSETSGSGFKLAAAFGIGLAVIFGFKS